MAESLDESLSSCVKHKKDRLEFSKKHLKDSKTVRLPDLMKPRLNCLASIQSIMSGGHQALLTAKFRDILEENLVQST